MDISSPVFAALGAIGFDALDDLSNWLDGPVEPAGTARTSGWPGFSGDRGAPLAAGSAGREG